MDPRSYFDPPSEREWTDEERDKFFAAIDLMQGATASNAPVTEPRGIYVTRIDPPEQGWPIAMHCPICKETTFVLSQWAIKPKDGDYFLMKDTCGSDVVGDRHNMQMACEKVPYKRLFNGPHDAIITSEMTIEEAKRRFPESRVGDKK